MTQSKFLGFQVADHDGANVMGDGADGTVHGYPSYAIILPEAAGAAAESLGRHFMLTPIFEGVIEEPIFIGLPEISGTVTTPREDAIAETAACLWEETQRLLFKTTDDTDIVQRMKAVSEALGAAGLRCEIVALAPHCHAAWEALSVEEQDAQAPFDWGFVPQWLEERISANTKSRPLATMKVDIL